MSFTFPPQRILMAPGPSNVPPRVLQALTAPLVGHKDPYYLGAMDETAALLRQVFQTSNQATLALPASGGSGMEAALINLLEPGDTLVVGDAGFFAHRMVDIARRLHDVKVVVVDTAWGCPVDSAQLLEALQMHRPRVLAVVHGETSTGIEQPLDGLATACHDVGALLVVDAVATLGGVRLAVDEWDIDICYSGSQKCLSAPPGLAPITVSDRAMEAIQQRRTLVQSWYLDLGLHAGLWGPEHTYHHTSPVLNVYALREALRIVAEEGLSERLSQHRRHAAALGAGVEALGLEQFAHAAYRVPSVVTVLAPSGISAAAVRAMLLQEFNLEIACGLGEYADGMWRIGIMGHSAQKANVMLCLLALEQGLRHFGYSPDGSGTQAAQMVYSAA